MQYAVFVYVSSAQRSYRICFSFYSKQKTVSGANRTSRERNEHLIMGERKISKKLWSEAELLIIVDGKGDERLFSFGIKSHIGKTLIQMIKVPFWHFYHFSFPS